MANSPRLSVPVQRQLLRVYRLALVDLAGDYSPFAPLARALLRERIKAVRWQDYPAMARLGIFSVSGLQGGVSASRAVFRTPGRSAGL